jgi:hypothetical protein
MKKALKKTLKISAIALGALFLLVVAAALLVLFDKPLVRSVLRSRLGSSVGTTARFGRLDYSLFPLRITVDSLEAGQEDAFQKLAVSVTHLEAKGDAWKLVRGVKPALDSIEAEGVSFRLEQKAVSDEPMDLEAILLQASDTLAWARRIAVTNARLSLSFISGQTVLENLDITLQQGSARDLVDYAIGRGNVSVKAPDGSFLLTTGLASKGTLGLVSPFSVDADFALSSPHLTAGGIESSLAGVTIAVTGRFDRSTQELAVSRLKVGVPGLLDLDGTAAGKVGYGVFLEAEGRARFDSLEAAAAVLGARLPAGLRAAKLRGRAGLTAKYVLQRSASETKDTLNASLALDGIEFDQAFGGSSLHVRASGRIDASGPTRDPRLTADLRSSLSKFSSGPLSVSSSSFHLVGSATKEAADVSRLDADLNGLDLAFAGGKKISFDKAALTGKGRFDLGRKALSVPSLEARLPGLAPLRLSARLGFGSAPSTDVRMESKGLDIASLRAIAAPFIPAGFAGWDLGGAADLSLGYRAGASEDEWGVSGRISLSGASFNDPSFSIAGEGLDPVLDLEGARSGSKGISFGGSLDIGRGESLWKAVYVSWSKHPLKLTFDGRFDPSSGAIDGLKAGFLLPTIGEVDVAGSAKTRPSPSFDLRTDVHLSLGPLYSLYSQAGVSEEARTKLEGKLEAALIVRKDGNALSVGGRVTLADTNLERPLTKTRFLGIAADLPVRYESWTSDSSPSDAPLPEEGFLRIGELQNAFLALKSVTVPLRAGVNALAVEPLSLELYGGRVELGRTTFRFDPRAGSFRGVGSLALREIDISRFPIQSPQFKLTGKVRADFPRLDISSKEIAISGRGEADVFGGKVVLRDFAVADPFTPGRSISLNVDLVDLDLKKLTDEVPFGEVTGIVSGEIRGLVITYNQPERFDFRIESVPRKGVPQTFSLKAVDNLTVLSSGQQASAGTGGFWMRFIRGFRYEKLGIVSTLRNDTFTLNGTIHEGGTEYLVKKPALFGISVVNRMPDKVISFREMTSRLKRVGQSER